MTRTVGIVGSRHWHDYEAFCRALPPLTGVHRIVTGGALGVDMMAAKYAELCGYRLVVYRPERVRYGSFTVAAHARNQQIADASDWLIAMPGPESRGTYDTIRRARKRGIRVTIIEAPV